MLQTAVHFGTDEYLRHFTEVFRNLDIDEVSDWVVALLGDNTALNPKVAKELGVPHIGCRDHSLDSAGEDMMKSNKELAAITKEIRELHSKIKASNCLSAQLQNIQDVEYKLHTPCATRWHSVATMYAQHERACDDIRELAAKSDGRVSDATTTNSFLSKMRKHNRYLKKIKSTSKGCLQERGCPLACLQDMLDYICDRVEKGFGKEGDDFEFCTLKKKKLDLATNYDTDKAFVRGVIKIQKKMEDEMTEEEVEACEVLLKQDVEGGSSGNDASPSEKSFEDVMFEKKRSYTKAFSSKYVDCRFILGSGAEVERVWSMAGNVYTKRRSSTSPLVLELILYLNYNKDLWGIDQVALANTRRRSEKRSARVEKILQRQKEWEKAVGEMEGHEELEIDG